MAIGFGNQALRIAERHLHPGICPVNLQAAYSLTTSARSAFSCPRWNLSFPSVAITFDAVACLDIAAEKFLRERILEMAL